MDNQKILLVNLAKGRIGEDNTALLGSLIVTKLQLSALSRIDIPERERKDFFCFIDEFQSFVSTTGESFSEILSESRKYRLCLIIAHQYLGQLGENFQKEEKLRKAIFGNAGTIIAFKVGPDDAEFLEKEFYPEFERPDLINQDKHNIYLKLAIDGRSSKPFSALTLAPFFKFERQGNKDKIIKVSRMRYSSKKDLDEKIGKVKIPLYLLGIKFVFVLRFRQHVPSGKPLFLVMLLPLVLILQIVILLLQLLEIQTAAIWFSLVYLP